MEPVRDLGRPTRAENVAMRWALGAAAVAVTMAGCDGDAGSIGSELASDSNGITLNTSSWTGGEGEL